MEDLLKHRLGVVLLITVPILLFGITLMTGDLELGAEVAGGTLLAGLSVIAVSKLCRRFVGWQVTPQRSVMVFTASIGIIVAIFLLAQFLVETGVSLLEQLRERLSALG